MRPLEGITVVAVEQAVAAPFATRQLADLGARVIKIERPDGGDFARAYDTTVNGLSSYFVWLNRSKESLAVDLKHREGIAILDRLLERADVFVQNLAPGAADRIGTAAARLRARHPGLVVCNVSGYGSAGPYAARKAYDLLVQSEVGLVSITGPEASAAKVGISVADIAAGMYAYSGVLAALLARVRTTEGATVDVSLFDALAEWMSAPMYYTKYGGAAPARTGANHASIAPYGPFRAGDGGEIVLGVQNAREWERFCGTVLERPELAADQRFATNSARVRHRGELHAAIDAVFSRSTAAQLIERLASAQIAYARLNSVADFLQHPQLASRDVWRDIASPSGPLQAMVPPARIDRVEPVMGGVPALGGHTDAILAELGFDEDAVARLRAEGVIR
jgi:itaconate CoA-transferase